MESPSMLRPTSNVTPASSSSFIQRFYILLKAHYFLFFASFGIIYPILNITLRSRGLSNTELSFINIIIPFLVFFTNPLLGFVADRSRRYLLTFSFVLGICTLLYAIMFLLPSIRTSHIQADLISDPQLGRVLDFCASQEVATQCSSRSACGCSYQANCTTLNSRKFSFQFSMNSKNVIQQIEGTTDPNKPVLCGIQYRVPLEQKIQQHINRFSSNNDLTHFATCEITCSIAHFCHGPRHANQMTYVVLYSLLYILGTCLLNNAIALGASVGFAAISNPDSFGQQRVVGTFGFGIAALAASRIYGIYPTDFVYIIMFSIATILCIIVTNLIRTQPRKDTVNDELDLQTEKKSQSGLSALLPLLKKVDVLVFLSLTFAWGISFAGLDPYLYLYIDEIAPCQSRNIVGWMSSTLAISEIAGFFLAARIIKLLGTSLSSVVIFLAFALRFAGYYFIRQPYFLIPVEVMNFFNFGVLYVLIVRKADSIAPPGLSGTLQGVGLGVSYGLGRGVGLVIASFIYTLIEQRLLFLIIAIFNLIAALIYSIYFILTHKHSKKSTAKPAIEDDMKYKSEPLLVESTN